jgi:hypothetical protein
MRSPTAGVGVAAALWTRLLFSQERVRAACIRQHASAHENACIWRNGPTSAARSASPRKGCAPPAPARTHEHCARSAPQARCWAALSPARGVALYDSVLRDWPRGRTRDGGLYLARLARACAGAGELDRARAEGRKALAIARTTRSSVAVRELKQLTTRLPERTS